MNLVDPDGNTTIGGSLYMVIGGGISISFGEGHLSVAVEVGAGTPSIGVEINPNGEVYKGEGMDRVTVSSTRLTLFLDVGAEKNVAGVTLAEGKLRIQSQQTPCPDKLGPIEISGKRCVGAICLTPEGIITQVGGEVPHQENKIEPLCNKGWR